MHILRILRCHTIAAILHSAYLLPEKKRKFEIKNGETLTGVNRVFSSTIADHNWPVTIPILLSSFSCDAMRWFRFWCFVCQSKFANVLQRPTDRPTTCTMTMPFSFSNIHQMVDNNLIELFGKHIAFHLPDHDTKIKLFNATLSSLSLSHALSLVRSPARIFALNNWIKSAKEHFHKANTLVSVGAWINAKRFKWEKPREMTLWKQKKREVINAKYANNINCNIQLQIYFCICTQIDRSIHYVFMMNIMHCLSIWKGPKWNVAITTIATLAPHQTVHCSVQCRVAWLPQYEMWIKRVDYIEANLILFIMIGCTESAYAFSGLVGVRWLARSRARIKLCSLINCTLMCEPIKIVGNACKCKRNNLNNNGTLKLNGSSVPLVWQKSMRLTYTHRERELFASLLHLPHYFIIFVSVLQMPNSFSS